MRARLRQKTERAMLVQKRAQARPPATVRNRLKAAGWLYDPVAAVWHLPTDPEEWAAARRLLDELEQYDIQRLAQIDE